MLKADYLNIEKRIEMYKIKSLNNISKAGLDALSKDLYHCSPDIVDPDAILVRSCNMHDMDLPPSLVAIARAGAGVNNIPVEECSEKGIVVFNTPGANANAVKELVLTGLFLSSRRILESIEWVQSLQGKGEVIANLVEKGKSNFTGPEIKGKKLGVIGLGAIGVMVANDACAIGMDVTGYDPFISVQSAWGVSRGVQRATSLDALLAESDYITIHIPLLDKTRNIINQDTFSKMKKGVRLLNFSRGELVNMDDLLEALDKGILSKYVTDFPTEKLLGVENVIPIPHLGASTPESEDNCAVMAVHQLQNYLENGSITNSVNYPDCDLPRSQDEHQRITIAHKNIPNMVGQITSGLASRHINIPTMINKSKGNYAYTIIDAEGSICQQILEQLSKIDGVQRVRVLG